MGCSGSREAPARAHLQPPPRTAPQHTGGGGLGVLDAAVKALMITMMCHLSCGQTLNGLHCTPVPGCAGKGGGDTHIKGNRESGSHLSLCRYSVSS